MGRVLIAYNDDMENTLHEFMESCADEAKQSCVNNGIDYSSISPPNLNEQNVMEAMQEHHLCFIAGHGDAFGVYNEQDEYIVSTQTTNYNFAQKGFYSIACYCAKELHSHLQKEGLQFFVGYNRAFHVRGEYDPFIKSAMSGLSCFLSGENIKKSKEKMLKTYDEQIKLLDKTDPIAAAELLHNKEALVFEGDNNFKLSNF